MLQLRKKQDIKKTLLDVGGSGIERAKNYLSNYAKMDFPDGTKEWQNITNSQTIRNVIVHPAGHLNANRHTKAINIVSAKHNLESESFARTHLVIEGSYLIELASDLENLCLKLLGKLKLET